MPFLIPFPSPCANACSVTLSQGGPRCRTEPGHRCGDGEGSMCNCCFSGCRAPYLLCTCSTRRNEEGDPSSFLPLACQAASIVWQAVAGFQAIHTMSFGLSKVGWYQFLAQWGLFQLANALLCPQSCSAMPLYLLVLYCCALGLLQLLLARY